jgi:hypothetical protein
VLRSLGKLEDEAGQELFRIATHWRVYLSRLALPVRAMPLPWWLLHHHEPAPLLRPGQTGSLDIAAQARSHVPAAIAALARGLSDPKHNVYAA